MSSFNGKVAVITGAGSGIGRALAKELDRLGARLALSDINEAEVKATAAACADARAFVLDVADRDALAAHVDEVVDHFGGVDIVINNAGVTLFADAEEASQSDIDWLMDINLNAVVASSQLFLPHLIASGDGHLVNVSSVFGIIAMPSQAFYNAAKFGVRGYTEALAMEMAINRRPVQIHTVHPGGIRTNMAANARVEGDRDSAAISRFFTTMLAHTSPEAAARTIIRGMRRGRRRIHIGLDAHIIHGAERLLGATYMTGLTRVVPTVFRLAGLANRSPSTPSAQASPPATPSAQDKDIPSDIALQEVVK